MKQTANIADRRAPGPRGGALLGNVARFRRDPLALLLGAARDHGDVVRLRLGPVLAHLVNHPDDVGKVLKNPRAYDKNTRSVGKIRATCGNSLLSSDGQSWLAHRRTIQPAFQADRLERFVPLAVDATRGMLDRWRDMRRAGQPVEIVSEMAHVTLGVAARILFGADVAADAPLIERALATILDRTWRRVQRWFDPADYARVFRGRRFRQALAAIDRVVYRIIEARRQQREPGDDLLSILLAARDPETGATLDDRQLRDATITLLLAGHETTANALAWTMCLLAQSPPCEERLRDELQSLPADDALAAADLARLDYTGMVFAEAIRLYPSIWILERRVVADDTIGGFRISRGSTVLISPYVLHRHPRYWTDPETFDPQRFAPSRLAEGPKHAYLPFGLGPHQCIGQSMAGLVARAILATVYRQCRPRLVAGHVMAVNPGITLRHAGPVWMTIGEEA